MAALLVSRLLRLIRASSPGPSRARFVVPGQTPLQAFAGMRRWTWLSRSPDRRASCPTCRRCPSAACQLDQVGDPCLLDAGAGIVEADLAVAIVGEQDGVAEPPRGSHRVDVGSAGVVAGADQQDRVLRRRIPGPAVVVLAADRPGGARGPNNQPRNAPLSRSTRFSQRITRGQLREPLWAGRAARAHRAGTPRRLSVGHPAREHLGRLAGTGFHRGRPHRAARSVADEPAIARSAQAAVAHTPCVYATQRDPRFPQFAGS